MRIKFIECRSRSTAKRNAPWAAVIARAEGGFWAFEGTLDYWTWRNQK